MLVVPFCLAATPALSPIQEEHALFDALVVVADKQKRMEALIDFQNDGYTDALTYWWSGTTQHSTSYRLFALVNDQMGAFDVAWEVEHDFRDDGDYPALRAITGNLNDDALTDFVVYVDNSLHLFHSNGLSEPDLVQEIDLTWTGQHVVVDLDGDGLDDLVAVSDFWGAATWMNGGTSVGYQFVATDAPDLIFADELRSGELTGDGIMDLLVYQDTDGGLNRLRILPGNGDGTFGESETYFTIESGLPVIGDIDGDGDQDIVLFGEDTYKLLERTGRSTWQFRPTKTGGPAYAFADVDSDGDLDGICCGGGSGGGNYDNDVSSVMHISLNDGTGDFAPSLALPALGSRYIAGAADLDHDGDMDLVGGRSIYYGTGDLSQHPWGSTGTLITPYAVSDYEGDGDLDLRSGLGQDHRNDGSGQFTYLPGNQVGPVGPGFAGDFDGDGHTDFMTRTVDGEPRLCRGDGAGGTLAPEPCMLPHTVDLTLGGGNYLSAANGLVVDADADGDLDVIVRARQLSNPGSPRDTHILSNDGTGWFQKTHTMEDALAVGFGNADGDGHPDLFAVQPSSSLLGYYPGLGNGALEAVFVPILDTSVSYELHEVAIDDWNADGFSDIAVPTLQPLASVFFVYWGTGTGAFVKQQYEGPKSWNTCLAVSADVDGNGWNDLLIGNTGISQTFIFRRRDDGAGFRPGIIQLFRPIAAGDFDTDGDLDFAANYRWIPNRRFEGNSTGGHRQYGQGFGGAGSLRPILGAKGPFRAGEAVELRLLGGRGGAIAQLKIAFAASDVPDYPFPGMHGYAHPWFRRMVIPLDGEVGAAGAGRKTIDWVVPASLSGTSLYYQFFVLDPEAPYGWSSSNGLEVRYR